MAKKLLFWPNIQILQFFFLKKLATKLLTCYNMNKHLIKPEPNKQLSYEPIYSTKLIELENFQDLHQNQFS